MSSESVTAGMMSAMDPKEYGFAIQFTGPPEIDEPTRAANMTYDPEADCAPLRVLALLAGEYGMQLLYLHGGWIVTSLSPSNVDHTEVFSSITKAIDSAATSIWDGHQQALQQAHQRVVDLESSLTRLKAAREVS